MMLPPEFVDNAALHRFEFRVNGVTTFLVYTRGEGSIRLIHTEVPDALKGEGIGSKLVEAALQFAQENKLRVIPVCPFVSEYLKRHHEYLSLVDPEYRWMVQAS